METTGRELIKFIDASPTPYHAVDTMAAMFANEGFIELKQEDVWVLDSSVGYFVKNNGSIIAFLVGEEQLGCKVIAAHTDSPNLHVKPVMVSDRSGYMCLNVESYGGVLLNTWLEKKLSLAGVAHILENTGKVRNVLFKVDEPIARISQLAIHLNRTVNETGLIVNPQTQMFPIIGLTENGVVSEKRFEDFLRKKAGILDRDTILAWDLSLCSAEPSVLGGLDEEFIYAPRLDNLASCYAAATALCNSSNNPSANGTYVVACFNHEEVGSESDQGATSPFLQDVLGWISSFQCVKWADVKEEYRRMIAHSICISSDMAHALNPNYPEKHDAAHAPIMNKGIVLKSNINQRYATNADTAGYFIKLCQEAEVPYQHFVNRADLACGTTLGPMIANRFGMPTVDIGAGMLSMHASEEQAGIKDIDDMVRVFTLLFSK